MKKINLKLTTEKLDVINSIIDVFNSQSRIETKEERLVVSIISELYEKLAKKAITHRYSKKHFTLNLKYYEAYALEWLLRLQLHSLNEYLYEYNTTMNVANEINKQL